MCSSSAIHQLHHVSEHHVTFSLGKRDLLPLDFSSHFAVPNTLPSRKNHRLIQPARCHCEHLDSHMFSNHDNKLEIKPQTCTECIGSYLERLPVEVFEIITLDLDLPAYRNLRLTSRQLHLLSLSTFSKRYFAELTTTLGSSSLDRLVNIADRQYLSNAVSTLDIKILNHRDYKILTHINRVGIFPPPKRFQNISSIKAANISQESTLYDDVSSRDYPKCIVDRLTRALRGLHSLKTIRFRAHRSDPYEWRHDGMPKGDQNFRSKCFQAVFDAIIKSEIQLDEFSMAKGKRGTKLGKSVNIPYPTLQLSLGVLPAVQYCFTHLKALTLSINSACNGDSRTPGWENGISHLIACAPALKSLALSLDSHGQPSSYSAAVMRSLASSCQIDHLEAFHLYNCQLHGTDLATFTNTHATTLRQITLSGIRLVTGTWPSFWTLLKDVENLQKLRLAALEGTQNPVIFRRRRDKVLMNIILDTEKADRLMPTLLDDLIAACDTATGISTNDFAEQSW